MFMLWQMPPPHSFHEVFMFETVFVPCGEKPGTAMKPGPNGPHGSTDRTLTAFASIAPALDGLGHRAELHGRPGLGLG